MLFKEIVDARTDGRTDGRRTPDIEGSQKLTEHFLLRWDKNLGKLSNFILNTNFSYHIHVQSIYKPNTLNNKGGIQHFWHLGFILHFPQMFQYFVVIHSV